VRLRDVQLTAVATPGHTPGALSWHWNSCDGGVCRRMVYADSLSPISRDQYRFSDQPAYVAAYRAGLAKLAALECEILLTPHPSASGMIDRMAGRAALADPNACRDYAQKIGARLDERLAKERAAK
jgi:metallo-beta-lactamase class B